MYKGIFIWKTTAQSLYALYIYVAGIAQDQYYRN